DCCGRSEGDFGSITRAYRLCPLNPFSFHSIDIFDVIANSCWKYNAVSTQTFCCIKRNIIENKGNYYSPGFTVQLEYSFHGKN
uniref:Uncharacterized protein n=1 Tax=Strigops habroptila TaxID=2489341 RepID=A0A672UAF8_STRHB